MDMRRQSKHTGRERDGTDTRTYTHGCDDFLEIEETKLEFKVKPSPAPHEAKLSPYIAFVQGRGR